MQSFEIFFPPQFKSYMFDLYSQMPIGQGAQKRFQESYALKLQIQQYLIEQMDSISRNANQCVRSKTLTEKVFGVNQSVNRISSKLSGVAYEDSSS